MGDGRYNVKPNPAKRKPGPITEAEKQRVRELAAEGKSIADIAREIGVGTSTVSRIKKREGLTVQAKIDNTAGTQAFAQLAREARHRRRLAMDQLHQRRAEMLLAVMDGKQTYPTILKGAMGIEGKAELDFIPPQDWRSEVHGLGTLDTQIGKIDDREDDQGLARGLSILEQFAHAARALTGGTIPEPREGLIQE